MTQKWFKPADLAKELGVSHRSVLAYLKKGKIPSSCVKGSGYKRLVHVDKARSALKQNLSYINRKKNGKGTEEKAKFIKNAGEKLKTLAEAQQVDANYKALLRKFEYEREQGMWISAEQIEKMAFDSGRKIRDSLLNIPERVAALVAAEESKHECKLIILREINHILDGLNDALQIRK